MTDKVDDMNSGGRRIDLDDYEVAQHALRMEDEEDRQDRAFMAKHHLLVPYEKHEKTWRDFEEALRHVCVGNEIEAMTAARRVAALALEAAWARQFMLKARRFAREMRPIFIPLRKKAG